MKKRGRPYVYSSTVILRCFIVRLWFRMDSNNALHEFLGMDYAYQDIHHVGIWDVQQDKQQVVVHVLAVITTTIA
jgi:hypothetical protein